MKRIYQLVLIVCSVFVFSCNTESEQNKDKRNENWAWWVDDNSGKGMWIPIVNESTVENGKFTLFYFNGNVSETGTMKNKENVDTTFFYNLSGKLYGYRLNLSDTDGVYYYKNGRYKLYYNDGSLHSTGIVTNHHAGDDWKVFYKNGRVSFDTKLKNGIGFTTEYFENGHKKSIIYNNDSVGKSWYVQQWYENGQLEYTSELKNGKYDGVLKRYYENGQIKKIWEMKNGIHHGPSKEYYENGQIEASEIEVNGLAQGKVMKWYRDGKIKGIGNCKDGKFDGFQQIFYENGNIKLAGWIKNGVPHGEAKNYDLSGKLTSTEIFSNGKRIKSVNTL